MTIVTQKYSLRLARPPWPAGQPQAWLWSGLRGECMVAWELCSWLPEGVPIELLLLSIPISASQAPTGSMASCLWTVKGLKDRKGISTQRRVFLALIGHL